VKRHAPWAALLWLALAGCTSAPTRVYVQMPRNVCDQLADDEQGRLRGAPADAGALIALLPWKGDADSRYRWYERPDGGRLVCIYNPQDGCSPRTYLFQRAAAAWILIPDAGRELVCTADTRVDS
jgi:hypothetical protein